MAGWRRPCAFLTSKERDTETGLDYFGARYYGSTQGRFTSVDPEVIPSGLGSVQAWNKYSYALGNPLLYVDPDGRAPQDCRAGQMLDQDIKALMNKEITTEEYNARINARALGAAAGLVVVGAVVGAVAVGPEIAITVGLWMSRNPGFVQQTMTILEEASGGSPIPNQRALYEAARAGGRHAGFLANYAENAGVNQIQKGIRGITNQIQLHLDKIQNPTKYVKDWNKLSAEQRKHLLTKKWPGDIKRQLEQLGILKELLKEKPKPPK